MRNYDANIPTMEKINYLVKRADHALLSSQPILIDKGSFGSMNGEFCDGVNNKLGTHFGEFGGEEFPSHDESR